MKRNTVKLAGIAAALILTISFLIFSLVGGTSAFAGVAASPRSSFVLDDLRKDTSFNATDYPFVADDYNLYVKQIAESTDGELLVYVYQPSGLAANLIARSIDIAREKDNNENIKFKNYGLELLNCSGVFFKYRVIDFKLESCNVRYYNISNILRPFDSNIDTPPASGAISEVPNRVAQLWTVRTVGDNVTYEMDTSEIVEITQKHVGYCVYDDGVQLGWGQTEGITKAYFVAFSTDRQIDKLISADLSFFATRTFCKICLNKSHTQHDMLYDFHDSEYIDFGTGVNNDEPLTITDKQSFGNQGGGNVRPATKYLFKRIRKTEDFIADNNNKDYQLTSAGSKNLDGTEWVLNFYEAQDKYCVNNVWGTFVPGVSQISGIADGDCELNNVYDVQILRLEFETEGTPYNLGVIDNKQASGYHPDNEYIGGCNCDLGWLPWWAWIAIICLSPLLLLILFKLLKRLIKFPFRLIKKRRQRRERERQREEKRQAKANKKTRKPAEPTAPTSAEAPEPKKKTANKKPTTKERTKKNEKRRPRKGKEKKNTPRRDN